MTDEPKYGERVEPVRHHAAPRMSTAGAVVGIFLLLLAAALVTPFIIALWRWAFAQ